MPTTSIYCMSYCIKYILESDVANALTMSSSLSYVGLAMQQQRIFSLCFECGLIYPHVFYPASGFLPDGM